VGKSNLLKADLESTYGTSYATIEMLLNTGMKAYDELCALPDNTLNNGILIELKDTYYPSFSTILMLYKEAYERLNK